MSILLIATFLASLLFVIFKLVEHKELPVLPVLVVNYLVAGSCGLIMLSQSATPIDWRPELCWSIGIGALFIAMFFLMAKSTQQYGMGVTTIAAKLSVVAPFMLGVLMFDDPFNWANGIGLVLAGIAIWASSTKSGASASIPWLVALGLFVGNGAIDIALKLMDAFVLSPSETAGFSTLLFGSAGLIGGLISLLKSGWKVYFSSQVWKWGLLLGVVNFFSIFLFMKSLTTGLKTNMAFPVYNIGLVVLATVWGFTFFRERKSVINWIGLACAASAIYLLTTA